MKKILVIFCWLSAFLASTAPIDSWTTYLAYHNNTFNLTVGDLVYSLCDGNLFSYNTKDTEVRLLSKLEGLNGKYISFLGYSTTQKTLVLVYDDANIDLMTEEGDIVNIPQLKNAELNDLVMNSLCVSADMAAIATNTGFALIDLQKQELKGVYDMGEKIYAVAVFDGKVFAAREATILTCPLTANMSDQTQWTRLEYVAARDFVLMGDHLLFTVSKFVNPFPVGLWSMTKAGENGKHSYTQLTDTYYNMTASDGTTAVFSNDKGSLLVKASAPEQIAAQYARDNVWKQLSRTADGTFWASEETKGLVAYKASGTGLVPTGDVIGGYGPVRDYCYYMRYAGERLLIAGGRLDPYDRLHYDGTLMYFEDGKWTFFQEEGIEDVTGVVYRDMTSIIQDPKDYKHHFATSCTGLYEFRDLKLVHYYSNENSPLKSAASNGSKRHIRLDGLNYDSQGNLWLVNNQTDTTIRVLKTDGTWDGFAIDEIYKAPTLEKTLFDTKGRFWVASRRSVSNHSAGLLCLDYNGTLANKADDRHRYRSYCLNQDGTSVKLNGVYAIIETEDGQIWVGTGDGLFVIENPDEWFDSDFTITQVKVPRNDGTNYADYLLSGVPVSAIATDGANRKWIGTYGSGLYLVSPDGTEILEHFTADETPLLSDNIYSIVVDNESGEVMIGTNMGLCSYQSGITAPASDLRKNDIKVYPNPVRPEYSGMVTITGLTENADIVITTAAGYAVRRGTATGGTFIWDVKDTHGERVGTGVYYIMLSTSDASKGVVAKVIVL